jgi:hypothetical protein
VAGVYVVTMRVDVHSPREQKGRFLSAESVGVIAMTSTSVTDGVIAYPGLAAAAETRRVRLRGGGSPAVQVRGGTRGPQDRRNGS